MTPDPCPPGSTAADELSPLPAGQDRQVAVALGDRGYVVHIGPGVRARVADMVRALGARRVAVLSARHREWVPDPGVPFLFVEAKDGEQHKTLATVEALCR